jgi:hypothetical protein
MKFLLFNVVVAASLGYLLLGDNRHDTVAPVLSQIEARGKAAPVAQQEVMEDEKIARPDTPPAVVAKNVVPKTRRAPAPVDQEVSVATVSPPAVPTTKAEKIAAADPAVAKRRAEVLGDSPSLADQTETPQFMTPTERRKELARLAEDMELRFLEKVGD